MSPPVRISPYRMAPGEVGQGAEDDDADADFDADIFPVLVALWIGSVVRVVLGVARHEHDGIELPLASLTVLAVPWPCRATIGAYARRVLNFFRASSLRFRT